MMEATPRASKDLQEVSPVTKGVSRSSRVVMGAKAEDKQDSKNTRDHNKDRSGRDSIAVKGCTRELPKDFKSRHKSLAKLTTTKA